MCKERSIARYRIRSRGKSENIVSASLQYYSRNPDYSYGRTLRGLVWDAHQSQSMPGQPDEQLADVVTQEAERLRRFILRRVRNPGDAEDILQDVFLALYQANRLLIPIEHITGWLFRVARNRIIDVFRRDSTESLELDEILPAAGASPEEEYARTALTEVLERAIAELPAEQREVFVAHELDGLSFKEIGARTGLNQNTLLARKRYAVLRLREQLRQAYEDLLKG